MKRRLAYTAAFLVLAGCYAFVVSAAGTGLPCLFRMVTGLLCPGCGVTRMLCAMLRMDFPAAFRYHPVLFLASPAIVWFILRAWGTWMGGKAFVPSKWENFLLWAVIFLLLIYGVCRNVGAVPGHIREIPA